VLLRAGAGISGWGWPCMLRKCAMRGDPQTGGKMADMSWASVLDT
jgi:hypothetical protein